MATRYRCSACGNLTRFDVVTSRRTRAYHHFTVGGELRVEDETVLDQRVEAVTCRWCGTGASVEVIDEAGEARAAVPAVTPDLPGAT
ncbi:MAG TPA: hypothetical protein VFZ77_15990 [Acidimicrobiales bacterium]